METNEEVVLTVKRGRGRPKRDGASSEPRTVTSSTVSEPFERTAIEDDLLKPYKIIVTENSYNVVDALRKEGAIADNPYAYCTTLGAALYKVARLKTTKNKTYSLNSYIKEFTGMLDEFRSKFNM